MVLVPPAMVLVDGLCAEFIHDVFSEIVPITIRIDWNRFPIQKLAYSKFIL